MRAPNKAPTLDELLPLLSADGASPEETRVQATGRAVLISSKCANVTIRRRRLVSERSWFMPPIVHPVGGVLIGTSLPSRTLLALAGRAICTTGFIERLESRALAEPTCLCIVRDVNDAAAAVSARMALRSARPNLPAQNPPTVGHFAGSGLDFSYACPACGTRCWPNTSSPSSKGQARKI